MAETTQDYYAIIGVPRTATQEEIRSKYWELSKKYHPDIQTEATKKIAEIEMGKISEAYSIIGDPAKRAEYDQKFSKRGSLVNIGKNAVSSIDKFLSNERVANRVGAITQNVGWSYEGFSRDIGKIAKGAEQFNQSTQHTQKTKDPKSPKQDKAKKDESAMSILKKRYAKGDITKSQYMQMKKELQ